MWTWVRWQWRDTPPSPKLQHYWNLTIRLFSVIYRTLIGVGLTPLQRSSRRILQPQPTGQNFSFQDLVFSPHRSQPNIGLWRYPSAPRHINFFEPFHFLAGDQLVVPIGASHISSLLQEIQSRVWEEREQTNKWTIWAWVNSKYKKRSYVTLHSLVHM